MKPIDFYKSISVNKTEIQEMQTEILGYIEDYESNQFEAMGKLNTMAEALTQISDKLKSQLFAQAQEQGGSFETEHFKVNAKAGGRMYDFSDTGDPIYEGITSNQEHFKKLAKERQAFLKGLKEPMTKVDEETGEVITINPPAVTFKKDSLTVKLK